MDLRHIEDKDKENYNKFVTHIMQSWQWGDFRISTGTPLVRYGIFNKDKLDRAFQISFHKIPFTSQYVGYLPKGPLPDKELASALEIIASEKNCAFIKLEPNILSGTEPFTIYPSFLPSPKPLFTKYNFIIDLSLDENTLLKNTHPKTRYNIKLAQKKGVKVLEKSDDKSFEQYLELYFQTTKRQGYHGHNRDYHKKVWEVLKKEEMVRLLIAYYKNEPLTAWMLFNFKDILYYPYGGSSQNYREVMASNLIAWEAVKLGKKLGLKKFDMWGALGPDADPKDPWYGFHRFKQGYGGELVEYIGTFDLVKNQALYFIFTSIDKLTPLKVFLLKIIGK